MDGWIYSTLPKSGKISEGLERDADRKKVFLVPKFKYYSRNLVTKKKHQPERVPKKIRRS